MSKEEIIWSICSGFVISLLFFILGWIFARSTNIKIHKLWRIININKARNLFKKGKIEEALMEYETLRSDIDEDDWFKESDFFSMAIGFMATRNLFECIRYCYKIIDLKGTLPIDFRIKVAVLCLNNRYYSAAIYILSYGESGNDANWHSMLAWALSKNHDYTQARYHAEVALQIADKDDYSSINRCGIVFNEMGIQDKAHECYKHSLLSQNPEMKMWANNNIGAICSMRGNECAMNHDFKNKVRFDKATLSFYKKAYVILKENRLWETAIDPSLIITNLLMKATDVDDKSEYIEFALEIAPHSVSLYVNIAWMYYDLEDYQNSLKNAQKAYNLNPTDIFALEVLAASYLKNHKYHETISTAFEAWKVKSDIMHGNLEGYVAEAHDKLGNTSEALKYYKLSLAKGFNKKGNYSYFYKKAIMLSNRINDFQSAISLCLNALIYLPDNKELQELLNRTLQESGNTELFNFNPFTT